MRLAKALYLACDLLLSSGPRLFSFFNDRYAAKNPRNDSFLIFWSSPSIRLKKGLNFWRKPFVLFCFCFWSSHQLGRKKVKISGAERFLFLSLPSVRPKKRLNFWPRPFFLFFGLCHQFGRKKVRIFGEGLSVLVRWNGGGPLEPC